MLQDDYFLLSELVHDYIGIVGAVKDVLNERVKAWQSWQGIQVGLGRLSKFDSYRLFVNNLYQENLWCTQ